LFDFTLPEARIARYPAHKRSGSALLHVRPGEPGNLTDWRFSSLPELLRPGDLLVVNNSRVVPARLYLRKSTGGKVELLLEREIRPCLALALLKSSKPLAEGAMLEHPESRARVRVGRRVDGAIREVTLLEGAATWLDLLQKHGETPLPPYINRAAEELDRERYQTIYANQIGSVAAPTAGLHFDQELLNALSELGVELAEVTLHVGYGTFAKPPANTTNLHAERYQLPGKTAAAVTAAKERGNRVIAVGTTSARVLESVALQGSLRAREGETKLCIKPGFPFKIINGLITNFHLPGASLLWLVCAYAGTETMQAAYNHALAGDYRFYSYGDAMFIG